MSLCKTADNLEVSYLKYLGKDGCFIPSVTPLKGLPQPFNVYIEACNNLAGKYEYPSEGVRPWLNDIFADYDPALNNQIINLTYWEKQKLMSSLSILAHTYRWNRVSPSPDEYKRRSIKFPAGIQIPFFFLADLLGQPKCGTLWNTTISNWNLKNMPGNYRYDNQEITMENLQIAHSWLLPPKHKDLERWVLIFTVMEARGAAVIRDIVTLISLASANALPEFIEKFEDFQQHLTTMLDVFNREVRTKKLDHVLWRQYIQPTFIWGLEIDGELLEGASGLQLGCTQCVDIALDIMGNSTMAKAMIESRRYLPQPQRLFLQALDIARPVIRMFVTHSGDKYLKSLYNNCIELMLGFRKSHKARGKMYMKGDGKPKSITTTGLSIHDSEEALKTFEKTMLDRIDETQQSLL